MNQQNTRMSKFLSLVLRHSPERIGISLDASGWTSVRGLLDALARYGEPLSEQELHELVGNSDKQRFAFNADHSQIRANQGHSIPIDLKLSPTAPPPRLYHGTAKKHVPNIMREGLLKRHRHHVHLHEDSQTAAAVGRRHGPLVLLTINASAMSDCGFRFYVTANHVWLTETVPPEFINPYSSELGG